MDTRPSLRHTALALCALAALAPAACGRGPAEPSILTLTGSWSVAAVGADRRGGSVTHRFLGRMSVDGTEIEGALGMVATVLTRR